MAKLGHKKTDQLSPEAQRVMIGGFRARKTYAAIAKDLAEIGETVPERSIARRASEWRQAQERRDQARDYVHDLVDAMRAQSVTAAEMVQALATDALLLDPEAFTGGDPIKVQRQNLRAEELRLKRDELEIKRRLVSAEEERLRLLVAREQRAIAALQKSETEMTPEQRLREIQEIYGIRQEANG
jgi:hypothetical protein